MRPRRGFGGRSDVAGGSDDDTRSLDALTSEEREVLAVLASVGDAALTSDELALLTELEEVRPIVSVLEHRGFLRREGDREALAGGLGPELRRAWDIADTADRVLRQFISIAEDGKLTLDDLPAILGITEWAAEAGRWTELIRLVKVTETVLDVKERVDVWIRIVEKARRAARAAGDRESEAWAESQLAASRASTAEDLTRPIVRPPIAKERSGAPRWLAIGAGGLVLAGAGFGIGYWVSGGSTSTGPTTTLPGTTITLPPETTTVAGQVVTLPGQVTTVQGPTVTLPPVTTTETTTVTVTQPPPSVG